VIFSMRTLHAQTLARLVLALVVLCLLAGTALAQKRLALVIGNDAYEEISKLEKAVNDATAISDTLKGLGFEVTTATDVGRRDMNRAIQDFVSGIQEGDTAMFFYAGHGVEIDGENYLLPVDIPDASPGNAGFIETESMPLDDILARLRERNARLNLVVLDACRNNPFSRSGTRSLGGGAGLARISAPQGTFVMYSADVGEAALDRLSDDDDNPNSVFTRILIPLMKNSELDLVDTARQVRREVRNLALSIGHQQTPAYYDAVLGDFFFADGNVNDGKSANNNGTVEVATLPSAPAPAIETPASPQVPTPANPPSRSLIVTGGEKDSIRLWDGETGSMISELEGEKIVISTLKLVDSGKTLIVAGSDGALFSYSLPGFKKINALYPGIAATSLAQTRDGTLVLGGSNGMMAAINPLTFDVIWQSQNHTGIISPIIASQDGSTVVSASGDGTVALTDTATGKLLGRINSQPGKSITDIAYVTQTMLVAVHEDGTIAYLNTRTAEVVQAFAGTHGWISSVGLTPDTNTFVTANVDGSLSFWATNTGNRLGTFQAHDDVASGAKFMQIGGKNRMISTSFDGFLKVWNEQGRGLVSSMDHGSAILHLDYTGS